MQMYKKKPMKSILLPWVQSANVKLCRLKALKVTADRRGDNSPMLYRSRNAEMQIIRSDDTQINIKTLLKDKIK